MGKSAHPLLSDGGAVGTQDQFLGGQREVRKTGNGKVLVVEIGVVAEVFFGLGGGELVSDCLLNWQLAGTARSPKQKMLTFLTTGKTHGFALSSLYAPIPKSTLLGSVSRRNAAIKPKRGSSGACGTTSALKEVGGMGAICRETWERRG